MAKKNKSGQSIIGTILAVVVVIIGALIYAVTGIDFLGIIEDGVPPADPAPTVSGEVRTIPIEQGYGATDGFWTVYFTDPLNTRDRSQYQNGVDEQLAAEIGRVERTLDIAAFELNNEIITQAILDAHNRGVAVRMVVDDEHTLEDDDSTIVEIELAGIEIVDDDRSGLMHNKFMIMDRNRVWMGSMNFTQNGVYRNNNNALLLRSPQVVSTYQAEFNEMFERGEFGVRSDPSNTADFTQNGIPIEIYFASENEVIDELLSEINNARRTIRFMTFSFTRDDLGQALVARAETGVVVTGVSEVTGSQTQYAELPRLYCAGLDVYQDGNNGVLHHKVFIIDERTVITGSFNYSNNAVESNDENVLIIRNADIAALYLQEFERVRSIARVPDAADMACETR